MQNNYIQSVIRNLKKLEVAKENLEKQIKEYEAELKDFMLFYEIEELHGSNGEKVIYKEILGKRFDSTAFKRNFANLYNSYLKNTKSLRFKFSY